MSKHQKPSTLDAKKEAAGVQATPHGYTPGAYGATLLRRLQQVSPAILEVQVQRALTDPLMKDDERSALCSQLLELGRRLDDDQRKVMDSSGMQALTASILQQGDAVPDTPEDITAMEARADRMQAKRIRSHQTKLQEWREQRAKAVGQ